MSVRIHAPTPTVLQVSGERGRGEPILSVLVKRTYRVDARGQCVVDEEQPPLQALRIDPARRKLLLADADVYPYKPLTDIVVLGHAYPAGRERRFAAEIRVGSVTKSIAVTGDRTCALSTTGALLFSDPAPFDRMPLSYDRAYGGVDAAAEARFGNPYAPLAPYLPAGMDVSARSPYLYPRNPSGRGYLIAPSAEAVARLALPNLEDPSDLLGPDRLAAGSPHRWPRMPLPWATGWLSHAAFPRSGCTGAVAPHEVLDEPWVEVARGFAPAGFPRIGPVQEVFDDRFWNGGSLGLQMGPLGEGVERVEFRLVNMHPTCAAWWFRLPGGAPVLRTDRRKGKLNETTAVLHHVVIEPDLDRVTVVWRGAATALRRYALAELMKMPLLVEW
jgi:hypothetical protein